MLIIKNIVKFKGKNKMSQEIYEYLMEAAKTIRGNLCHNGRFVACDGSISVRKKKIRDGKKVSTPPKWAQRTPTGADSVKKNKDLEQHLQKIGANGNAQEMEGSHFDIGFSGRSKDAVKNSYAHIKFREITNEAGGYSDTIENLSGVNPEEPYDGKIEMGMFNDDDKQMSAVQIKMEGVKSKGSKAPAVSVTHTISKYKDDKGDTVREAHIDKLDFGLASEKNAKDDWKTSLSKLKDSKEAYKDNWKTTLSTYSKMGVSKIHTANTGAIMGKMGFSVTDPRKLSKIHSQMSKTLDAEHDTALKAHQNDKVKVQAIKQQHKTIKKVLDKYKDDPSLPVKVAHLKSKVSGVSKLSDKLLSGITYEGNVDLNSSNGAKFRKIVESGGV